MTTLESAPSWFLVFLIAAMAGVGGPSVAWVAIKYFGSLHQRFDDFDDKLERLTAALSGLTPVSQHISAYDKLHTKLDQVAERLTRLEEHQK